MSTLLMEPGTDLASTMHDGNTARKHAPAPTTCPFCRGSGRCAKCDGDGARVVRKGRLRVKRTVSCVACEGSGECDLCHGAGVLHDRSADGAY